VLVVWGDADIFADPGFPERAQRTLPHVQIVVLRNAGHCPDLDDPQAVGRAIARFLGGVAGPATTASARQAPRGPR
jgi:pimeloyl-ACP methyl ester carboxylesterase